MEQGPAGLQLPYRQPLLTQGKAGVERLDFVVTWHDQKPLASQWGWDVPSPGFQPHHTVASGGRHGGESHP